MKASYVMLRDQALLMGIAISVRMGAVPIMMALKNVMMIIMSSAMMTPLAKHVGAK
jgi:hypothetical protein